METAQTAFIATRSKIENEPGHWVLARVGKRVLRPGGRELTQKLVAGMLIGNQDDVIEFAPGLGFTARLTLAKNPQSYLGIDAEEAAVNHLSRNIAGTVARFLHADILESGAKSDSASKIYGEAMLTMQPDRKKVEIIREAHRLLRPGGLYGIHELGLTPDEIAPVEKQAIQKELSQVIKVNARPLTVSEWRELFEDNGFEIVKVDTNSMRLLEFGRMFSDEGFWRTIKIIFNILRSPKIASRVIAMPRAFRKHRQRMNAVMIVARKK